MELFMRLGPCSHADALEKAISLSLNHLPTLNCRGISLFRIKKVEPKQTPGDDP